mgnify:CR=1 FL=1
MKNKKKIDVRDFQILYDNVLIKSTEIGERDGIIKPAQYDDKPEMGEVIGVGEGRIFDNGTIIPLKIKMGDTVFFNKYSSTKFNFDGDDVYIVREEDVIAFIR